MDSHFSILSFFLLIQWIVSEENHVSIYVSSDCETFCQVSKTVKDILRFIIIVIWRT